MKTLTLVALAALAVLLLFPPLFSTLEGVFSPISAALESVQPESRP